MNPAFWTGKRVFVTGHTGFKGSWLCLWLRSLGAQVTGYALAPEPRNSLFEAASVGKEVHSVLADIRDRGKLHEAIAAARPEIVIHMAAQALVRSSYIEPVETYEINVMGTVYLLESIRTVPDVRAVVVVTSDKCYENREWVWGYRESDPMGGHDPYSSSKGCAELVTAAYRSSFFLNDDRRVGISSARAGNVIGGGDWATDRLVPDTVVALAAGNTVELRNPAAVRPWQHVLEPLAGYLTLAERLHESPTEFSEAWNFGPSDADARPVSWVVSRISELWGRSASWRSNDMQQPHEAAYLKLDCSKARTRLGWTPRLPLESALPWVVEWYKGFTDGSDAAMLTMDQIDRYARLPTQ